LSATQQPVNEFTDAPLSVGSVIRGELPQHVLDGLRQHGIELRIGAAEDCPPARIAFAGPARDQATNGDLHGRRILVLHSNPEQASLLTWALSARGADTSAYTDSTSLLADASSLDADVVLVDEGDLLAASWEHVCALWRHLRLRWTPCLVAPPNLLEHGDAAELDGLCAGVQALAADRDQCVAAAREPRGVELPLAALGPARTLRALLEAQRALAVELVTPRLTVEVDLAEGLILGARGRFADGASIELLGARALAALLEETRGTVRVQGARAEPLSNVMASLDKALAGGALDSATTSEDSVLLLLTNPSSSGIRPVSIRNAPQQPEVSEEDLGDPTRKLSDLSVLALMKAQQVVEPAAPESPLPQPGGATAAREVPPGTRLLTAASSVARRLLVLTALALGAFCALLLWREFQPFRQASARKAAVVRSGRAEVAKRPAAPLAEVAPPAPEPLAVATIPSEGARDPSITRLVRRANDLRRRRQLSRARKVYERALALAPDEPSVLAGLARTAIEQDDLSTALACARKLVALQPDESNYRVLLERVEKRNLAAPR
jgi:hypothetical protein